MAQQPKSRKLTAAKAKKIYRLYHEQGENWSQRKLAKKFGVSRSAIYGVTARKTWRDATANRGY